MDTKYPELFTSRSGKITRDTSVLSPCSKFPKRASRIFADLSIAPLASPPPTLFPSTISQNQDHYQSPLRVSKYKKGIIPIPCSPISRKSFYRTFNRFARDLYLERRELGERITGLPLLFDLKGDLIPEQQLRKWSKKGLLFEAEAKMPSSCKDIRTFPL
jgi:hypothetical protein